MKFAILIVVILVWRNLAFGGDIFDAVKRGDVEEVRSYLKNNPDLVFTNGGHGMTPLHLAVASGHLEVMELLLASNANVDATDKFGKTPLDDAAFYGRKDVAEMLIRSNANVNTRERDGSTPLITAAGWGKKDVVELLLNEHAAVNVTNTYGKSALREAVEGGYIDVSELLLAGGADVHTRDRLGFTPLAYATKAGAAQLLLAHGADVNARDSSAGGTPLHWAAFRSSKGVTEVLLASNADVNAKDNGGETALHWAARNGHIAVVELLLASNANVNATDKNGDTPLQIAFDKKDVAELLHRHGGHGKKVTTRPLVGWYLDGDAGSPHEKAITDDCQAYAHTVWPKDRDFFIAEVNYYEDGAGKHAVRIELEPALREYKEYYLIYDANNVRVKVIKGKTWHEWGT